MKKKILAMFTAFMMLISFVTPTFANENTANTSKENTIETRAVPMTTHNFTKTKTINGVTVKIRITCYERLLGAASIMEYTSGDCTLVSTSGGSARITSDFISGSAGVGVDDDLIIIVYFTYTNESGATGSSSVSFTIRENELV